MKVSDSQTKSDVEAISHTLPPGRFGLPYLGETIGFLRNPNAFVQKRQAMFGPIFKTHLFGHPTVMMIGPEANRFILSDEIHRFSWRGGWPASMVELGTGSLLVQDGDEHERNRRALVPAFHGVALVNYIQTIEQVSQAYLHKWQELKTFRLYEELRH